MVNIKTTLSTENTCGLYIKNVTGYYNSVSNPTGFLTAPPSTSFKAYQLNDVYQFTYVIKNSWNGTVSNISIPGNTGKNVVYNNAKTYDVLMEDAGINQHVQFTDDGYYSIYQFAIPKESIKSNIESAALYTYYVKPDLTVWVLYQGISTEVDMFNVLTSCDTNWSQNNIVVLKSNMVSKCYLEICMDKILEVFSKYYTDPLCIRNSNILQPIKEKRDLLFAITNTIEYYVELGQYYQAAKLIYDTSYCNICKDYLASVSLGCNCNN